MFPVWISFFCCTLSCPFSLRLPSLSCLCLSMRSLLSYWSFLYTHLVCLLVSFRQLNVHCGLTLFALWFFVFIMLYSIVFFICFFASVVSQFCHPCFFRLLVFPWPLNWFISLHTVLLKFLGLFIPVFFSSMGSFWKSIWLFSLRWLS